MRNNEKLLQERIKKQRQACASGKRRRDWERSETQGRLSECDSARRRRRKEAFVCLFFFTRTKVHNTDKYASNLFLIFLSFHMSTCHRYDEYLYMDIERLDKMKKKKKSAVLDKRWQRSNCT